MKLSQLNTNLWLLICLASGTSWMSACRSMDMQNLSKTHGSSLIDENLEPTIGDRLAPNCRYTANRAAIPRFCNPLTRTCETEVAEGSIVRLLCYDSSLISRDLSEKPLKYALLSRTDLTQANLTKADIRAGQGDYAKFHEVQGKLANFSFSIMIGVEFINANLHHAKFISSQLLRANFNGAHLTGAVFHSAELRQSSFKNALLKGTSFVLADLQGANFEGADLRGADFTHANTTETNFSHTKNLQYTIGLPDEIIKAHSRP